MIRYILALTLFLTIARVSYSQTLLDSTLTKEAIKELYAWDECDTLLKVCKLDKQDFKAKYEAQKMYSDKSDSLGRVKDDLCAKRILSDQKYLKKVVFQRNMSFIVGFVLFAVAILK